MVLNHDRLLVCYLLHNYTLDKGVIKDERQNVLKASRVFCYISGVGWSTSTSSELTP